MTMVDLSAYRSGFTAVIFICRSLHNEDSDEQLGPQFQVRRAICARDPIEGGLERAFQGIALSQEIVGIIREPTDPRQSGQICSPPGKLCIAKSAHRGCLLKSGEYRGMQPSIHCGSRSSASERTERSR